MGKSAQKNPPGKSPTKSSKFYTTKIPDTFLQRGRAKKNVRMIINVFGALNGSPGKSPMCPHRENILPSYVPGSVRAAPARSGKRGSYWEGGSYLNQFYNFQFTSFRKPLRGSRSTEAQNPPATKKKFQKSPKTPLVPPKVNARSPK